MNALALFWVTDSVSERCAAGPRSGATGTTEHPVYEMSSERSHHKDTVDETDSRGHQRARPSWSPLMALDWGFRVLFVRESAPRESGTMDVEVSFQL